MRCFDTNKYLHSLPSNHTPTTPSHASPSPYPTPPSHAWLVPGRWLLSSGKVTASHCPPREIAARCACLVARNVGNHFYASQVFLEKCSICVVNAVGNHFYANIVFWKMQYLMVIAVGNHFDIYRNQTWKNAMFDGKERRQSFLWKPSFLEKFSIWW